MSRVLFINPPWWVNGPDGRLRRGVRAGSRWPFTTISEFAPDNFRLGVYLPAPLFLMSAAAWVKREFPEHEVILRDSIARGESYTTFSRWLVQHKPDYVVLETGAASWEHDRNSLLSIKKKWPDVKIGVAGPTVTHLAAKDEGGVVDAWLIGEFEKPSGAFLQGGRGIIPFNALTRDELKSAPFPLFDEDVWHHYADGNPRGASIPELQLWGSRGCAWRCNFCAQPATMTNWDPTGKGKREIRFYSPGWIEGFIYWRIDKAKAEGRPLTSIRFDGDTENANNKHTLEICEVMRRIGLPWSMMCRADTSSREVWQEMKDSGCFGVKLGFESGSQRVVDEVVGKRLDLAKGIETARWLRSIGMTVHGTFTEGLPGETAEERQMTHDFIRKHAVKFGGDALDTFQLSGAALMEGTPMELQADSDPNFVRSSDGQQKIEKLLRT